MPSVADPEACFSKTTIKPHSAFHVFTERPDDFQEAQWAFNLGAYFEKCIPADNVKGLCKIATKSGCLRSLHFSCGCLVEKTTLMVDHICAESTLHFGVTFHYTHLNPHQCISSEELPDNTEEMHDSCCNHRQPKLKILGFFITFMRTFSVM